MNSYELLLRLRAFQKGKPLPRGSTKHFPLATDDETLILAFVRMGGESSPWGVAIGHPGESPKVLTVPEPRNRDAVAQMSAEVAPLLLRHVFQPDYSDLTIEDPRQNRPLRQIWLPNPTHLDMLQYLAYAYTFTKWGTAERLRLLNALGRACGWLFREGRRPGQLTAMVATAALREAFTFPAEDTRQGHLGFLLAWLDGKGGRQARIDAAAVAERSSIATALNPELERGVLEPLVTSYNQARTDGSERKMARAAAEIARVLRPELQRRFELTERALVLLRADKRPVNTGVHTLVKASNEEHYYQFARLEKGLDEVDDGPAFTPSPETDRHPAAAASRYYIHEASQELRDSVLLHDDAEMQAEAVGRGEAIRGQIVKVVDEGEGRKTTPVWVVETSGEVSLKLREGSGVCVAGLPQRCGRIRRIVTSGHGTTLFEVEITGLKTAARGYDKLLAAADSRMKGTRVVLVSASHDGIPRMKSRKVWNSSGPGSWLTHVVPKGPKAELPDEVGEAVPGVAQRMRP